MFLTQSPYFLMAALVAIASGAIFAVRFVKPEASEESDVIFATMGLIYSISLLLEGQRLIPLLFFAQVLLAVMAGWFAIQTFRLRILLNEKVRQITGVRPAMRRQGFSRTYPPDGYGQGRAVASAASGSRIRDTSSSSRSIPERSEEPARRPRPQLTSSTQVRPRRRSEDDEEELETTLQQEAESSPPPSARRPRRPTPEEYRDDTQEEQSTDVGSRRRPPRLPQTQEESYAEAKPRPSSRRVVEVESVEVQEVEPDEPEDDLF
ncbi:Ycf66 family protein [Synechococcus sp. O70.1]|uniref:Ycf66 family protein n=1 Tax=Synechococcus sp. O70.1 TaxID=2964535 RepID=UPI0039C4A3CB